jgi:RNA polymerase sigma-70 factor (ECF subfamily)
MSTSTLQGLPIEAVYEALAPQLRRYATAAVRDAATAEDIVQEAFVRLAVESQGWRSPRNPTAWLYRVVHNLVVSSARRAEVARRCSSHLTLDDLIHESPEVQFIASEHRRSLGIAMDAAGPDGRTGLLLAAQGYSGREIAEILGRSEAATRSLMCRARSSVRRELTRESPTTGCR